MSTSVKYLTGQREYFVDLGYPPPNVGDFDAWFTVSLEEGWYPFLEEYFPDEERWHRIPLREDNIPLSKEEKQWLTNVFAAMQLGKGRHNFTGAEIAKMPLPKIKTVISPWFPVGGQVLVVGEDGIGKTFLVMQMIESLVKGEHFLDYATEKSRVAFVQVDMGDRLTLERVKEMNLDSEDLLVSVGSMDACITKTATTVDWVKEIRDFRPDVIIFDSLRELHTMDENSSDTPPKVYMACRKLFGEDKAFAFVHHTRKAAREQNGFNTTAGQDYRGSSAWRASVDAELMMTRKTGQVLVSFPKTRICEQQPDMTIELNPLTLRFDKANVLSPGFAESHGTSEEVMRAICQNNPELTRREAVCQFVQVTGKEERTGYRAYDKVQPIS